MFAGIIILWIIVSVFGFLAGVARGGLGHTVAKTLDSTFEAVGDITSEAFDEPEEDSFIRQLLSDANQKEEEARLMTDYGRDEYYVSGKIGNSIRYVQDRDGNEKRLYRGSGGWWDDEDNFYEDRR